MYPLIPLAELDSTQVGKMGGLVFWACILIAGIAKCFAISRREKTNTKCVLSLALLLFNWLLISSLGNLKAIITLSRVVHIAGLALGIVLLTCTVLLAFLGLSECTRKSGYVQGRKQAIWALVLSGVLLALVLSGAVKGHRERSNILNSMKANTTSSAVGGYHTFDELNFRIKEPPPEWIKMDASLFNPDATFVMMRKRPEVLLMVISEDIGATVGVKLSALLEVVKTNVRSVANKYHVESEEPMELAGLEGVLLKDVLGLGLKELYYVRWIGHHNGIFYQLVVGGEKAVKSSIDEEAAGMFERFEIIDMDRVATGSFTPLTSYSSPSFAYTITPTNGVWSVWDDLSLENPEAEVGGLLPAQGMGFLMVPFVHDQNPADFDLVHKVMHESIGLESPERSVRVLNEEKSADLQSRTASFQMSVDAQRYEYQSTVWVAGGNTLFMWAWAPVGTGDFNRHAKDLRESVEIDAQGLRDATLDGLTPGQQLANAEYLNSLGLMYLDAKHFDKAIHSFTNAVALSPDRSVYLENALSAYSAAGRNEEALSYMAGASPLLLESHVLQAWKAWLLLQIDKRDEARSVYRKVFQDDYRNSDDLYAYADLLCDLGEWEECESMFSDYFSKDRSLDARMVKADVFAEHGKHEEVIEFLNVLKEEMPNIPELLFRLTSSHNALGQYSEALSVSDSMISNGNATAAVYYHKASAEYDLGWYRKAKSSLEKALELSPNDADITEFLTNVSATLGEGNNTSVKQQITPVKLPEELLAKHGAELALPDKQRDSSAIILSDVTGFSFERGKQRKSTRYRRVKVMNSSGVSQHSTLRVDFSPLNERLYVNKLVVTDSDGKVVSRGSPSDYYVIDDRFSYEASHDKTLCMPVANLKPGCTIETAVTREALGDAEVFDFERIVMTSSLPLQNRACFFIGDTNAINRHVSNGISCTPVANGLVWRVSSPRTYKMEPMAPPVEKTEPMLLISDATVTWKDDAEEYIGRIKERLTRDISVDNLAKTLVKDVSDPQDRINRVLAHVQKDYTYKPIEFGVRGQLPYPAAETIRNRYGDCKDHAVLAHELLSALSIKSSLVLLHSGFSTVMSVPTLDQFDHMILYIPEKEGCRFVDLTQKSVCSPELVPTGLAGRKAMILEAGNVRFEAVPSYADNSCNVTCKTKIKVDGEDISVDEVLTLSGHYTSSLRSLLKSYNENDRKTWAQHTIARYEPYAQLQSFNAENILNNKDLVLKFTYRIGNRCRRKDGRTILQVPNVWARYYCVVQPMEDRTRGMVMEYPFSLSTHTTIEADGMSVLRSGEDASAKLPFLSWGVGNSRTGQKHTLAFNCRYVPGEYPVTSYNQFASTMQRALQNATAEIELGPKQEKSE